VHFAQRERVTHLPFSSKIRYNIRVAHQIPAKEGGVYMEYAISFLIAVAAGVVCHYVIKWLDGGKGDK
jgi:hypothetical protein